MVKITNPNQFSELVAELEKNPTLAEGFNRGTVPVNFKEQWQDIATKLNALGPPLRDGDGWQKVWRDLKCKVKRKMVHNKAECRATGGGSFKQLTLSPLEEQVANLLQFGKQLSPKGMPQGVSNSQVEQVEFQQVAVAQVVVLQDENQSVLNTNFEEVQDTTIEVEEIEYDFTDHNITVSTNERTLPSIDETVVQNATSASTSRISRIRDRRQRENLLESHTAMQERVLTQMSTTLTEFTNKLNSFENVSHCLQNLVQIEEKKAKIMERQEEREKSLYEAEMKLKKINMEIKERELEILSIQTKKK